MPRHMPGLRRSSAHRETLSLPSCDSSYASPAVVRAASIDGDGRESLSSAQKLYAPPVALSTRRFRQEVGIYDDDVAAAATLTGPAAEALLDMNWHRLRTMARFAGDSLILSKEHCRPVFAVQK